MLASKEKPQVEPAGAASYASRSTPDGSFASGLMQPGTKFSVTFNEPGTDEYNGAIHLGMDGMIGVKAR